MKSEQEYFKSTLAIGMLQIVLFLGTVQMFTDISASSAKRPIPRSRSTMNKLRKARKNQQSVDAVQK